MGRKCIVPSCRNGRVGRCLPTGYSFPTNPELLEAWCKVIGINSSTLKKCNMVCEKHFEPKDFWPRYASGLLCLRPYAVPSRNLSNILCQVMAAGMNPEPTSIDLGEKAPPADELNTTNPCLNLVSNSSPVGATVIPPPCDPKRSKGCVNHSKDKSHSFYIYNEQLERHNIRINLCCLRMVRVLKSREAKTISSDYDNIDCNVSQESKKRGSVTKTAGMDFIAISSALKQGKINLPSSCWSYSCLGQNVIMFLCWDKDLKLRKKAVLHEDSRMSFYLGEELVADGTTQDLSFELEGCLRVLDMFERCKGLSSRNRIWSEHCRKYIFSTDGKQNCSACKKEEFSNGPKVVDAVRNCPFKIQPVPTSPKVILSPKDIVSSHIVLEHRAPPSSSVTVNAKNIVANGVVRVEGAPTAPSATVAASRIEPTWQNVMAKHTVASANSEFFIVVSGGGVVPLNIPCSVTKSPVISSSSKTPPLLSKNLKPEHNKVKGLNQGFVKKATARKSTGGPRKHPTGKNSLKGATFEIVPEAVITVEDEDSNCSESAPSNTTELVTHRIGADAGTQTHWVSDDFVTTRTDNGPKLF